MGATIGTGNAYHTHEFSPSISGVSVSRSLVFCIVLCKLLFIALSFFLLATTLSAFH